MALFPDPRLASLQGDTPPPLRSVNPPALHAELLAAGLPIVGVSDAESKAVVRIDWQAEPTKAQLEQAAGILAAHDPAAPSPRDAARADLAQRIAALRDPDLRQLLADLLSLLP